MRYAICLLLLLIGQFVSAASPATSVKTVVLDSEHPRPSLDGAVRYFVDQGGKLGIHRISAAGTSLGFHLAPGSELSAGYLIGDALWIHYRIARADQNVPKDWWIHVGHGFTDEISLYLFDGDRISETRHGGRTHPFASKEVAWGGHAFRIALDDTRPRDVYLRYSSNTTLRIPLQVFEARRFEEYRATENLIQGAFFGIMALFVLAALFRAIYLRSGVDASYALYILAVETNNLIVVGWFQQLGISDDANVMYLVGTGAIVIAGLAIVTFMRLFIAWPTHVVLRSTTLVHTGAILYILTAVAIASLAQDQLGRAVNAITLFIVVMVSLGSAWAVFRKFPNARIFLGAFLPFLLVIFLRLLQAFGLISLGHDFLYLIILPTLFHATLLFAAILFRDASERREKQRLDWEVGQLRDTVQHQSLFMRMLAHEVRTPLAIIDGQTQVMAVAMEAGQPVQRYVATIREGIRRLSLILERFITQDRLAGPNESRLSPIDIKCLAQRVTEESQKRSEVHLIRLECEHCSPIQGDEALLEVMLANLVDNAINYSPDGGPILIRISSHQDKDLTIEVIDEGIGIPGDMQERIFERYTRTEQVPEAIGAGLGLYIVRKIVTLHRGRVECRSESGEGSTFIVRLPLH